MKTLQEIKNDVADECGFSDGWNSLLITIKGDIELLDFYFDIVTKEYAEQSLDLAAETVEIKYVPYDSKLYDHPDWDLDNDGRFYQIDKDSILSLKDQLK